MSLGNRLKDAELMGVRVAIIVGNQFDKNEMIDVRLLHKDLIKDVIQNKESDAVGSIHPALREKIQRFDIGRLQQLGYHFGEEQNDSMESDGFTVRCGFSTLYWNLIQTLSCIKTYSSKVYSCLFHQFLLVCVFMCPESMAQEMHNEQNEDENEEMSLVERDIEMLLNSKVGDLCILDNYDVYYGGKDHSIPHGPGVLRMNDTYVIHSVWNHGIIDGELVMFNVKTKRCVCLMGIRNGVIKNVIDVNKRDTLDFVHKRRLMYQGNCGIIEKETWDSPSSQQKSHAPPFIPGNFFFPAISSVNSPYLVLPDHSESFDLYSSAVEIFSIGQYSFLQDAIDMSFFKVDRLRDLHIKRDCCPRFTSFQCKEVPNLTRIVIGYHCFAERKERYESSEESNKKFIIESCPKLKHMMIDECCFYEYGTLKITSMLCDMVIL